MKRKIKPDPEELTERLQTIIQRFENETELIRFQAFQPETGGWSMLSGRLERAAVNQADDGNVTFSRYAIWLETVRGLIVESLAELKSNPHQADAVKKLNRAANSLAAFTEIQRALGQDPNI